MRKDRGVFVTTYFSYRDALIQAYTLPYVRMIRSRIDTGQHVYLLTVEQPSSAMTREEYNSVRESLKKEGINLLSITYGKFDLSFLLRLIPSLLIAVSIIITKRIGTIHSWCSSGGTIGYLLSLLTFKPLVLDSFEPHAEVMTETGTWKRGSMKFRVLFWLEKMMARRASVHICCTRDMADYAKRKYHVILKKQYVKPACVNLDQFSPSKWKIPSIVEELGLQNKIVCVYAGKFGGLYLQQEVFDFFRAAADYWGDRFRALILSREPRKQIDKWLETAGLPTETVIQRFVSHDQIASYIGAGDFGIAPYQPVPSRKHAAPIKISEYWAIGLPVIITGDIADDSRITVNEKIGSVVNELTPVAYRKAVLEISTMIENNDVEMLHKHIRRIAEKLRNYEIANKIYREIYQSVRD